MKMTTRIMPMARRAVVGAACLFVVTGCQQETSPGDEQGHDANHAGHVIPAHKPKTFPDAVLRLREMNDRISRDLAEEHSGSSLDQNSLHKALDVANWLPEIAADSDMPVKPWTEVSTQSVALVRDYETILSAPAEGATRDAVRHAGAVISDLESLLASADPKWFAGPENHAKSP